MKRLYLLLALLAALTFAFVPGKAQAAQGLCINVATACNDIFVVFSWLSENIHALHGYEYGCGAWNRGVSGVMKKHGNTYFISLTGDFVNFDYSQGVNWTGNFSDAAVPFVGTYKVMYSYITGGVFSAHGAEGNISVTVCNDPSPAAPELVTEPDTSQ